MKVVTSILKEVKGRDTSISRGELSTLFLFLLNFDFRTYLPGGDLTSLGVEIRM
jgi:hypothetical protein